MKLPIFQIDAFASNTFSGNPAAVYFDLTYVGDSPVTLDSVTVEGSQSAMIHQMGEDGNGGMMMASGPLTLNSGETLEFKPGGFHVMAMQVSPTSRARRSRSRRRPTPSASAARAAWA